MVNMRTHASDQGWLGEVHQGRVMHDELHLSPYLVNSHSSQSRQARHYAHAHGVHDAMPLFILTVGLRPRPRRLVPIDNMHGHAILALAGCRQRTLHDDGMSLYGKDTLLRNTRRTRTNAGQKRGVGNDRVTPQSTTLG